MATDAQSARRAALRITLSSMRIARLLGLVVAVLAAVTLVAPAASAEAPFSLSEYVTDKSGVLSPSDRSGVESAVDKLYNDRKIRLWVVYVEDFSGQAAASWAETPL